MTHPAAAADYVSEGEFGSSWPLKVRTVRIVCDGTLPLVVAGGRTYRLTNAGDMSAIRATDPQTGKEKDLAPLIAVGVHDCAS